MNQIRSFNITLLIRWVLAVLIIILGISALFAIYYHPKHQVYELFDASQYPSGIWGQEHQDFVFSYFPSTTMEIVEDENSEKKYLHVYLPKGDSYKGFGIQKLLSVPKKSTLVVEWRHSGNTFGIQLDLKDTEQQDSKLGEVFSHTVLPTQNQWNITTIPFTEFTRNEYQEPNNPKDGALNTKPLQSVEFALPPNDVVFIDLRRVYFTSESPKWLLIGGLIIAGAVGLLLLVRTSREFLNLVPDERYFSNAISNRLIYILMTAALIHMVLNPNDDINIYTLILIYTICYSMILLNILQLNRKKNTTLFSYWMFALFAVGWWYEFPQTPLDLFLVLTASSIPIIQYRHNLFIYIILTTLVLFLPLMFQPDLHVNIQNVIYILLFSTVILLFSQGIHQNIITKMHAENTSTLYEDLFNNTSDAIFSFDSVGIINNANDGLANLLGIPRDNLIGSKIQDYVLLEDANLLPFQQEQLPSENLREYDLRLLNRNDEIIHTSILERTKKIKDSIISYQIIAHDLTKRMQIEQLEKEKKIIAESSEIKSIFLSNITHEIRTPLHGMMGAMDILECTELNSDQAELVAVSKKSGKRLLDLVNGVLDYSKIESGQFKLKYSDTNLEQLLQEVMDNIRNKAEKKQLKLEHFLPKLKTDFFVCDTFRIQQILLNLLDNAVKFTESGSITLSVTLVKDTDEYSRFRFAVTDTGIGINKEYLFYVFDVFKQVDSSLTRSYEGSGLGLAICKGLVEHMDGEIGVESEVGRGSTFWFEIPLHKATDSFPNLFK